MMQSPVRLTNGQSERVIKADHVLRAQSYETAQGERVRPSALPGVSVLRGERIGLR